MSVKVGQKAPIFRGIDQDGNELSLNQFLGKKIILYFYPKDNTPGCTNQACNLRDNHSLWTKKGYVIIGVSKDSVASHQKFKVKYDLPFALIADTDLKIHEQYGVWGEKMLYGKTYLGTMRTTFIIDENGKIASIITKVDTKEHTNQLLENDSLK